jgi:pimeloyl-ACP methyl ester carboxylesterase
MMRAYIFLIFLLLINSCGKEDGAAVSARPSKSGSPASALPSPFKSPEGKARFMAAYEAAMKVWNVPYEAIDVSTRFGITHLVVCGPKDAPPIVLLHGFGTSLAMWGDNIGDLSRDYRVYALDVMGQPGKSIPARSMDTRQDYVEWLTAVLDALRIEKTHMIGMSYGGWLTLGYAIAAPQRLDKIVLLSPAGSFEPISIEMFLRAILASLPGRYWSDSFLTWMVYKPETLNATRKKKLGLMLDLAYLGGKHFSAISMLEPIVYSAEELAKVKTPTLLLIGEQEVICDPIAAIKNAKRLMPSIRAELIPEASHTMSFTQSEIVDQKILAFFKEGT